MMKVTQRRPSAPILSTLQSPSNLVFSKEDVITPTSESTKRTPHTSALSLALQHNKTRHSFSNNSPVSSSSSSRDISSPTSLFSPSKSTISNSRSQSLIVNTSNSNLSHITNTSNSSSTISTLQIFQNGLEQTDTTITTSPAFPLINDSSSLLLPEMCTDHIQRVLSPSTSPPTDEDLPFTCKVFLASDSTYTLTPHSTSLTSPQSLLNLGRSTTETDVLTPMSTQSFDPYNHRLLLVHLTSSITLPIFLEEIVKACALDSATPATIQQMVSQLQVYPALESGEVDDDIPILDPTRPIHTFGIHFFRIDVNHASEASTVAFDMNLLKVPELTSTLATAAAVVTATNTTPTSNMYNSVVPPLPSITIGSNTSAVHHHLMDPNTRLLHACESGNLEVVRKLIENNLCDIDAVGNISPYLGYHAIHYAAQFGHLSIINCLLKHEVNMDVVTAHGWSAVMLAIYAGHVEIAEMLLTCGANVHLRDIHHHTAMYYAKLQKNEECINLLNEFGASLEEEEQTSIAVNKDISSMDVPQPLQI